LKALAKYSGLSVRKLREHIADPLHPLPHYRVGGKIVVQRSEFDAWIARFRTAGRTDVAALVDEFCGTSPLDKDARRARLHRITLITIERARKQPTLETLERIARALGVTLADLMK